MVECAVRSEEGKRGKVSPLRTKECRADLLSGQDTLGCRRHRKNGRLVMSFPLYSRRSSLESTVVS